MKRKILIAIGFTIAGLFIGLGIGYQRGCDITFDTMLNYNRSINIK